jgi:hypothetical protein
MKTEKKYTLMWRWSLITAGAIALFWTVWYLCAGSVPVVDSVKMSSNWTLELPFKISRWWDVLIGPIWSVLLISLFTSGREESKFDLVDGLAGGLVIGLGGSLAFGLLLGLAFGLAGSLAFGLLFGLASGLASGLAFGLAGSLAFGLPFGLAFGLAFGLVFGLAVGLAVLIKLVFSRSFWTSAGNWLLARDEETEV